MGRTPTQLKNRGLRVWVDSSEILAAERWAQRLEIGLKSSRTFALIVTKKALLSRWVTEEYLCALTLELQLVPLLAEDAELPVFLRTRQWVDFRQPEHLPTLAFGNTLAIGLVGWGATTQRITSAKSNESKLTLLSEALELCQERRDDTCDRIQREFWRVVHGKVGLPINKEH